MADRRGEYRISNLPPGTYTVTFSLPGFSSVIRNEFVVGAGLASRVDADLTVGNLGEGGRVRVWLLEAVGARPAGVGSLPLASP